MKYNKRVTFKGGARARLSFSVGSHAPVNMADSMEEVTIGGKRAGNGILEMFAALYCAIFTGFRKSLRP